MKNVHYLILILIPLLNACSEETCDQDTDVYLKMVFYSSGTVSKLNINELTVYGINMADSMIYDQASTSDIILPLNPLSSSCSFIFNISNIIDTVEISYQSRLEFISKACGYSYLYDIEDVFFTNNSIDNVIIVSKSVNPGDEENIRTFF